MEVTMDKRFDLALFAPAEVADYLQIPRSTLHGWLGTVTQLDKHERDVSIPFAGMAEARVIRELRRAGLRWSAIREAAATLTRELGVPHPLIWRPLAHDGRDILQRFEGDWERARDRQRGIPDVIDIGLREVEWAADEYPERLRLDAFDSEVVVDPRFAFGQPILWRVGVRVEDVIDSVRAGDPLDVVKSEFGVTDDEVFDITRFELRRQTSLRRVRTAAA